MQIRSLDLTAGSPDRATAIPLWQEALRHVLPDLPLPDETRLRSDAPDGHRVMLAAFASAADSVPAGLAVINETKASAPIFWVTPGRRHRGIGSALLAESLRVVQAAGHESLTVRVAGSADSEAFAQARGGTLVERDVMSGLDLATVDRGAFEAWIRQSPANAEYTLVRWSARCPEEYAPSFCAATAAMADAPGGTRAAPLTVEALREKERHLLRAGVRLHVQAAVTDVGEVVAFTYAVTVENQPALVEVWNTAVVRAHRRRGLALRVKAAATLWMLDEHPGGRWMQTFNHEANAPMRKVNRTLGYRPLVEWVKYEFKPEAASARS